MLRMILLNLLVWSAAAAAAAALARVSAEAPAGRAPDHPAVAAPAAAEPPRWPGPEAFAAISERPLFSPSRRPPARAEADAPPSGGPALALIGVVGAPDARLALVRPLAGGDGETLRLRPGDTALGWSVDEIGALSLTLSRGGARRVVELGLAPDAGAAAAGALEGAVGSRPLTPAMRRLRGASQPLALDSGEYLGRYDD